MLNLPDALKQLFAGRMTRQNQFYSPFLIGTDDQVDNLLVRALSLADAPHIETDSPLTTPPSSPPSSPTRSPTSSPLSEPPLDLPQEMPQDREPCKRTQRSRRVNSQRDKDKSKRNRRKRRQAKLLVLCTQPQAVESFQPPDRHYASGHTMPEQLFDHDITPSSKGFIGVEKDLPERREYSREELLAKGFRLHPHNPDAPCPILHSPTQSVMCVIQPGPQSDPTWPDLVQHLNTTIERLRARCRFKTARLTIRQRRMAAMGLGGPFALSARRGRFQHLTYGISYGNGQKYPMLLRQDPKNVPIIDEIRNDTSFRRLAGWMSMGFLTWAPKLFLYYVQIIGSLLKHYPALHLPFQNSVFAAFTVNFGPATVCFPHRDIKNLAFGWCAITALGDYDWKAGGHLVLWDLKLMIEFPPGTTIYIPSAILCHLNTTIQPHERRYSFTMFSAGGIFRWVEHGFQTEKMYSQTVSAAKMAADNSKRWDSGLAMFSSISELRRSS
ncbi:hypothetical protein VNI00_018520 [Paramarasmius palmivorus]|uniref:Uncharacterized protein n=1 Tax=Paramarasmius palmivorus TaxID=297713 RepID=A0AAW0AXU2_9AGAR